MQTEVIVSRTQSTHTLSLTASSHQDDARKRRMTMSTAKLEYSKPPAAIKKEQTTPKSSIRLPTRKDSLKHASIPSLSPTIPNTTNTANTTNAPAAVIKGKENGKIASPSMISRRQSVTRATTLGLAKAAPLSNTPNKNPANVGTRGPESQEPTNGKAFRGTNINILTRRRNSAMATVNQKTMQPAATPAAISSLANEVPSPTSPVAKSSKQKKLELINRQVRRFSMPAVPNDTPNIPVQPHQRGPWSPFGMNRPSLTPVSQTSVQKMNERLPSPVEVKDRSLALTQKKSQQLKASLLSQEPMNVIHEIPPASDTSSVHSDMQEDELDILGTEMAMESSISIYTSSLSGESSTNLSRRTESPVSDAGAVARVESTLDNVAVPTSPTSPTSPISPILPISPTSPTSPAVQAESTDTPDPLFNRIARTDLKPSVPSQPNVQTLRHRRSVPDAFHNNSGETETSRESRTPSRKGSQSSLRGSNCTQHPTWLSNAGFMRKTKCVACSSHTAKNISADIAQGVSSEGSSGRCRTLSRSSSMLFDRKSSAGSLVLPPQTAPTVNGKDVSLGRLEHSTGSSLRCLSLLNESNQSKSDDHSINVNLDPSLSSISDEIVYDYEPDSPVGATAHTVSSAASQKSSRTADDHESSPECPSSSIPTQSVFLHHLTQKHTYLHANLAFLPLAASAAVAAAEAASSIYPQDPQATTSDAQVSTTVVNADGTISSDSRITTAIATAAAAAAAYVVNTTTRGHAETEIEGDHKEIFMDMLSNCIERSDKLDKLKRDLQESEQRMNEMVINHQVSKKPSAKQDQQFSQQILEYKNIVKTQRQMMDEMEGLLASFGVHTKRPQLSVSTSSQSSAGSVSTPSQASWSNMWNGTKEEGITKMRWNVSQLVGGGVGTGRLVEKKTDTDGSCVMVIAGSGVTTESRLLPKRLVSDTQDDAVHHHKYVLQLNEDDRRNKFVLKSTKEWTQDKEVKRCEFVLSPGSESEEASTCSVKFGFLQRRHHCRSSNRLPLFETTDEQPEWGRVCDTCFHDLAGPHLRKFNTAS
ncbi:hypothetical protein F4703DRAFT_1922480 [Phycomyces blakesleeanus]